MSIVEREWDLPTTSLHPDGHLHVRGHEHRKGEAWTAEEYEVLIDAASRHLPLGEIATTLRRSRGGITARARLLLPPDWTRGGTSWWEDLCELLREEPAYQWEDTLREQGEPLVDYPTIREIEKLPRGDEESLARVMDLTGCTVAAAKRLLGRYGDTPAQPVGSPRGPDGGPLKVRNLLDTADHLPNRAHPADAGLDLRYSGSDPVTLSPATHHLLPTGIAVAVPRGHVGLLCPRSGLAAKHGVTIINAPGIIDAGYTGEIKACLGIVGTNNSYTVHPGERIAQLVITPILTPAVELVDDLDSSTRADGGFGSTGTD